jgi:FkbM family methyltransferase
MDLESAKRRLSELFKKHCAPAMPEPGTPLAVYGAGSCGRDALHVLKRSGYRVVAVLDARFAAIGSVEGVPCLEPTSAEAIKLARSGVPILVAVFNFSADTGVIDEALRNIGFAQVLPYSTLFEAFPDRLKSNFWLAARYFWESHKQDLEHGLELWDDDASRQIYLKLVELRLSGNFQLLRTPDLKHQYFPVDIVPPRQPLRFVDGGAFNGDTMSAIRRFEVERIAGFEPDPVNFSALCHWVEENNLGAKTELFQCGLGAKSDKRRFQQSGNASSAFSEKGQTMTDIVAMDEVLEGFAPTFIKLDIEGAEIEALKGGEALIRKHRPRIAACVYHLPAHLWEVPLLLRDLLPSHSLLLRYHGFNGFDAVAYAIEP